MDLKGLEKFEPITLLGVLNGMRKEIDLAGGCLKGTYGTFVQKVLDSFSAI